MATIAAPRRIFVGIVVCIVFYACAVWLLRSSDEVQVPAPPLVTPEVQDPFSSAVKSDPIAREIFNLYNTYKDDVARARARIWKWRFSALGKTKSCYGSLAEMEAELLYLRIRARQPKLVLEVAPLCGLSTMYILCALKDNGVGTLYSFDLVPHARDLVDKELAKNRWVFTQGDVAKTYAEYADMPWDFIFIDAAHTAAFARWYTTHVFAPHLKKMVKEALPPTPVQVHDIFTPSLFNLGRSCFIPDPSQSYDALYPYFPAPPEFHVACLESKGVNHTAPSPEGQVVLDFLEQCDSGSVVRGGVSRKKFDVSYYSRRDLWTATNQIRRKLLKLGEWDFINVNYINPSMFFEFALKSQQPTRTI